MPTDPAATADRVLNLLSTSGQAEYHGEQVSQLEHALQAAHLAAEDDGDEQEIIAALLHDIGHIWPVEGRQVTSVGVVEHDEVGAQALRELGFSDDVADIVSGHVDAKRYLVATDRGLCREAVRRQRRVATPPGRPHVDRGGGGLPPVAQLAVQGTSPHLGRPRQDSRRRCPRPRELPRDDHGPPCPTVADRSVQTSINASQLTPSPSGRGLG